MIKISRVLPLVVGVFLMLSSCGNYKNVTAPTVNGISDFKIGNLHDGKLPFSFTTRLKNPDKLKFHVKRVELELLIAGVRVAEINSDKKMKIHRQLEPELHWEVTAEMAPLLKNPGVLLGSLMRGKINLEVSGTMTVGKLFWTRTIPVKLKLPVEIPVNY
jgi:LEA14-like dessication related protein